MIKPKIKPTIDCNIDGNAYFILGTVRKALKKAGADEEYIKEYTDEATSGDYDNLLAITMNYVEFV